MANPKCFISYSWDSVDHKKWVLNLATKLQENGVETSLDQWDAYPGLDLTKYMETCVRDSDYVLMVCTPTYAKKANEGKGGVGYEKTIITGEIYQAVSSPRKFVPILRLGKPEESVPSFLKTKLYIDFTHDDDFKSKLEELIRHIHNEPLTKKPPLGSKPMFSGLFNRKKTESQDSPKGVINNSLKGKLVTTKVASNRKITSKYLFREIDGYQYFSRKKQLLEEEIQTSSGSKSIEQQDRMRAKLIENHTINPITLKNDYRTDNGDVKVNIRNNPNFIAYWDREDSSPVFKSAREILVHIPFSGNSELFNIRPSSFTTILPTAEITKNELLFTISFFSESDKPEEVERQISANIQLIKDYVQWLNNDIMSFNKSLEPLIANKLSEKSKRQLSENAFLGKLGVSKDF
jgi:hypothetical protein